MYHLSCPFVVLRKLLAQLLIRKIAPVTVLLEILPYLTVTNHLRKGCRLQVLCKLVHQDEILNDCRMKADQDEG